MGYWLSTDLSSGTYDILDLEQGKEVPTDKRQFMNHEVSGTAGGPLVKEKLSYTSNSYQGFAKLTWFATPDLTFQYQVGAGYTFVDN